MDIHHVESVRRLKRADRLSAVATGRLHYVQHIEGHWVLEQEAQMTEHNAEKDVVHPEGVIVRINGQRWVTAENWIVGEPCAVRPAQWIDFVTTRQRRIEHTRRWWDQINPGRRLIDG